MSDWEDIAIIPQDDGDNPVAPIAYSPEYKAYMDLFRGIVKVGEHSKRVIELTSDILDINAANYTVWQYRRQCLYQTGADLQDELDYIDIFADDNPKNYQIWFHRRAISEKLGDGSRELPFCTKVISLDAKNYHAWAHRQWVLKTFGDELMWTEELKFVTGLIETDVRNNSAWNQRWFVVHNRFGQSSAPDATAGSEVSVPPEVVQREADFAWSWIYCAVYNESSWNYLRGLVTKYPHLLLSDTLQRCSEMVESGGISPYLLALTADLREREGTEGGRLQALGLFQRLVEVDAVRAKYWTRRADKLSTPTPTPTMH